MAKKHRTSIVIPLPKEYFDAYIDIEDLSLENIGIHKENRGKTYE